MVLECVVIPVFLSAGHRGPEELGLHLVLSNSALVTEHHRVQEVQHVQVSSGSQLTDS